MEEHPPLHFSVVAIEKGAFESPSTKVANFTCLLIYLEHFNMYIKLSVEIE